MKDSSKKLAVSSGKTSGKTAFAVGKPTGQKVLPKLLELTGKQLQDLIENASKEEDSGIEEGVAGKELEGYRSRHISNAEI